MKLLISVVNDLEAQRAIDGGADIIDVKNPEEGSLGANFPAVIKAVRTVTPAHLQVSGALGDAPNLPGTFSLAAAGAASLGIDLIKVGLYGIHTVEEAVYFLKKVQEAVQLFRPRSKVIAAGYADARAIGSVLPLELPGIAEEAGVAGCMLDTAGKDGTNLFDWQSRDELERFVRESHCRGLSCALAGSLQADHLSLVHQLGVNIVGIRSAACSGNLRKGEILRDKVQKLKNIVRRLNDAGPQGFSLN